MAEAEHFESEEQLDELMKEAQNILTEQDPPAIYHGQRADFTVLGADIQGFVPNPIVLPGLQRLRHVEGILLTRPRFR